MHTSPQSAPTSPPASPNGNQRSSLSADRAYQSMTIAAMLLLLGSLWLFR